MLDSLSVVIPTFNRCSILRATLESFLSQELDRTHLEIIVVDDGSTDDTRQVVMALLANQAINLQYVHQSNQGAAAARNQGLERATNPLILFVDDDIIASPDLTNQHLRTHRLHPEAEIAVLGRVLLAPDVPPNSFNLAHAVHRWHGLQDGQALDWTHFLTGNISLKRSFLLENELRFDETLPRFQDTDLGQRSHQKGLEIRYNAHAIGYHNHDLTFEAFKRLNRSYGETLALLHHRHPAFRAELGEYLQFSWDNPPQRVAKDLLRPLLLNQFSVTALEAVVRRAEQQGTPAPAAIIHRIGSYHERQGYQEVSRWLANEQT